MTDASVELEELLDRDRIVALVNHYLGSLDDGVTIDEAWARTIFTEDIHVVHRGFAMDGIEAITFGHKFVSDGWERTLHFTSNHRIDLDGDRAKVNARLFAVHIHPGPNPPEPYRITNVFTADAVRTPDGWRISGMNQDTVWSAGVSHLRAAVGVERGQVGQRPGLEQTTECTALMNRLAPIYTGQESNLPLDGEPGYVVHYAVDRIAGVGPWAP